MDPVNSAAEAAQQTIESVWTAEFLGSPTWAWAACGITALLVFALLLAVRSVVIGRLKGLAERKPRGAADVGLRLVRGTWTFSLFVVAGAIGMQQLDLSAKVEQGLRVSLSVLLGLQVLAWGRQIVEIILEQVLARKHGPDGKPDATILTALTLIRFASMLVLVSIVALIVLDNAGVNITALVAGLGIGGLAVALAAQKVLGDLFGAVSIVLDKPFVVGDFIVVGGGGQMGTVETIGLKTTRLRALSGEQLVFPNADLLNSRIQNFQRMSERRVVLSFGLVYGLSGDQVRRVDDIVKCAVERQAGGAGAARFERCHFKGFGASSLDFECVYHVASADYSVYMDVQQAINVEVMERLRGEGIEFAYPTQVVIGGGVGKV
ncbi:MAG: mechanosensitive ion channel family protein [Phycisphaerales bacterium]